MTELNEAGVLLNLEAGQIDLLREDLGAAGWTVEGVDALLSPMSKSAMERDQLVPAILQLQDHTSAIAVLTRLFILAQPVVRSSVSYALPQLGVEGAVALGIVDEDEEAGLVRATVDLRPHAASIPNWDADPQDEEARVVTHNWWVASDQSQVQSGRPPTDDYVLGIASASTNLLRMTMRQKVSSAMDMGTGCGILALYLATHAKRVVATDISGRACNFTRFNSLLNQVEVDVRQGSLFEPVEGESFDLITSNPPFVITPDAVRKRANLEYRDGGLSRDNLIPLIMKTAVQHLNDGGTLQMLANWEVEAKPERWQRRPKRWVEEAAEPLLAEGRSVDAWVVQRDLIDVAQYAEWWMRDQWGEGVPREVWAAEYETWLKDFFRAGAWWVGLGSIAIRVGRTLGMPPGDLTFVAEHLSEGEPLDGVAVATALGNLELPEDWGDTVFERQADVREVRYYVPGQSDPELIRVTQGRAGGRERTVSSAVAALIGVSEGELTPNQVIPAVAHLLGKSGDDVVEEVLEALPELLRSGVLMAAEPQG